MSYYPKFCKLLMVAIAASLLPPARKVLVLGLLLLTAAGSLSQRASSADGVRYDYRAYTECKPHPEPALYDGGILRWASKITDFRTEDEGNYSPAFVLYNMSAATVYSFSCWVKIEGPESADVKAKILTLENAASQCIGTALVRNDCWSFLKGGFALNSSSQSSVLYFQTASPNASTISIRSASLQPFTPEQWNQHREDRIQLIRKRFVNVHVSDGNGSRVVGANVTVHQITRDFPFGSAISKSILGNKPYQDWFTKRFNAAVFENELKWYHTEAQQGQLNYADADALLDFCDRLGKPVRGHCIFWAVENTVQQWVKALPADALTAAVQERLRGLLTRYAGRFPHYDVNNEMLHGSFYRDRLGDDVDAFMFREAARLDPGAALFVNDYNVEGGSDPNATPEKYMEQIAALQQKGAPVGGIGLQGHVTNPVGEVICDALDKLAATDLPVWLTELDVCESDVDLRAEDLEVVLREAYAHPAVEGVVFWGFMQGHMWRQDACLVNSDGTVNDAGERFVDLRREWTSHARGHIDSAGHFKFRGYHGTYVVQLATATGKVHKTFSVEKGDTPLVLDMNL